MKRGMTMMWWLFLWIALWVIIFKIIFPWSILLAFFSMLLNVTVVPFIIIWFFWAPNNLCFTFVKEGTAEIVVKGGAFHKALIQWKGKTIKKGGKGEGNVVDGSDGRHPFGGLRWYGLWPIYSIYYYPFEWVGVTQTGEFEVHPPKMLDYVLLKDDVYGVKSEKSEDRDSLALEMVVTLTVRVINPRKAVYDVQNWFETLTNRIRPYLRDFITSSSFRELTVAPEGTKKLVDTRLWEQLERQPVEGGLTILQIFSQRYGIEIRRIETKDINPPEEYRGATLKKYLGERVSEARGAETLGALIQMMAQATGKKPEDIRQEVEANPELRKELRQFSQDLITRQMAIDGKSFTDIRVQGAEGMERGLLNLLALWRMTPGGKEMPGNSQKAAPQNEPSDESWRKKEPRDMTPEQRHQIWEEKFGKGSGKPQNP